MRILIVEDEAIMREGLARIVAALGHEVVDTLPSAQVLHARLGALAAVGELPDLLLTDVRMPPTHTNEGIVAALQVRRDHPSVAILVLSQYLGGEYAHDLLAASGGAVGYLLKDRVADIDDLGMAIDTVGRGGAVLDPEVIRHLVGPQDRLAALTAREREVLELMAGGATNQQISARLYLSAGAVEKHISFIFDKLGIRDGDGNKRVLATLAWLTTRE